MRGIIFLLDVIIGTSMLLILLVSSYYVFTPKPLYEEASFNNKEVLARDFFGAMAEARVNETSASPTLNNLKNGTLTEDELELSVLDIILTYWSLSMQQGNATMGEIAENITREIANFTGTLERYNYSIIVNNTAAMGNYSSTNNSVAVSSLIENTYGTDTRYGYMARAYLNGINTERSRYLYFGGFLGQGNITAVFNLPNYETITGSEIRVFSGDNFYIFVNGNLSGNFSINGTAQNFTANIISQGLNVSNLKPGNNTILIIFSSSNTSSSYFGGGFLRVDYETNAFYEEASGTSAKTFFSGIEGVINYYDGVYVPENLSEVYLHYYNEIPGGEIYFTLANATLYQSNISGEISVLLNSSNISAGSSNFGLNYTELGGRTAPIKMGTRTLAYISGSGYGDAVLVSDISGSMDGCDVASNSSCDCYTPQCSRTRINVAKDSGKSFIDGMLQVNGNRVGLVSFDTSVEDYSSLSGDSLGLKGETDSYYPGSSTCICCGINKSIDLLSSSFSSQDIVLSASDWKYNSLYPFSAPPDMNAKNWTDKDYNDSNWENGSAKIGFFNVSGIYRRQLNISNTLGSISNYPVRFSINLTSDYIAGSVRQYCQDLRFTYYNNTSGAETEISYYIESCNLTQTSNSSFWVRIPVINASSNTTIYMYYGNNFSSSANNLSICPAGIIGGKCVNFNQGFEDSVVVGKGFNYSIWSVVYGNMLGSARTQKDSGYYHSGAWAAEMKGDSMSVYIATREGFLNLSECRNCTLEYWLKLTTGNWESSDLFYLDIYDGSWHNASMNLSGSNYDTGNWVNFTYNLSSYNISNEKFSIRFRQGANSNSEESHLDDVKIYYAVSVEPKLASIGVKENYAKILSNNITTSIANNGGSYYLRKKFYLDAADSIINSTMQVYSDDRCEIYLNGILADNDTANHNASYWNRQIIISPPYYKSGWNELAVALINNDSNSSLFDLQLSVVKPRKRAMLVMSDGAANIACSGWAGNPINDAIQYACNARSQNITVYSVAFGSGADATTLRKIACWNCSANNWLPGENSTNCSRYFQSSNSEELNSIYKKIADDIINMSAQRQALYVEGGMNFRNVLYNDSYIIVNRLVTPSFGDGEFMLTFEKNCTNGSCVIDKYADTEIIDAHVTSYSGDYWIDLVKVSNSSGSARVIYNLSKYGDFEIMGDPYSIQIPSEYFSNGINNITLYLGAKRDSPGNTTRAEKLIYSIKVPGYVGYGGEGYIFNSSQEAEGNATQRLGQYLESMTGEHISDYAISTSVSIEGVKRISQSTLVKFVLW